MENKKVKQSIIAGALTGSAGIFITKALSLLYVIPFNAIAKDATVFYSYAYTVYDSVLQVCLSGIPYAIATLVAKYSTKEDYQTVAQVRKVSKAIVLVLGCVSCIFMLFFANWLAYRIVPTELQATDYINKTVIVLRIVAFALIFVPILSYYRGVYQGLKELKVYAFTQVYEQIVRIGFLLGASCLLVYAFKMDYVFAAYMGVASTSVSAIAAILYFIQYDKNYQLPEPTSISSHSNSELIKELVKTALPYLFSSLMLSCSGMFVLLKFAKGLEMYGVAAKMITVYQGIINYQGAKLTSIPQVIMSGFCIAIIPHVTEAVVNQDFEQLKSLVQRVLLTVNYLSVPIICLMVFFSKEIFYVMYGNYYLADGASILAKLLVCQLFMNFYGIMQSILIAMQQRKTYLRIEACRLCLMLIIFTPFLANFGLNGYYLALVFEYVFFITLALRSIQTTYDIGIRELFAKMTKSWVGCLPMLLICGLCNGFKYTIEENSRILILLSTGMICVICCITYVVITYRNGAITEIFGFRLNRKMITRFLRKITRQEEK